MDENGEEVKLYGLWYSPFSRRVEMALKLKGVPYEYIEDDLFNKSSDLLKYNPVHKKVPVLVHKGKPMAESLLIIEYIDDTWKTNPILPLDPYDRAMARFWANFISELGIAALKTYWLRGDTKKDIEETQRNLKTLEEQLQLKDQNKLFFGGEGSCFIDMAANFLAHWITVIQEATGMELITEDNYPTLCKWAEEYKTRPLVKEFLPPRDVLSAHYNALFAAHRSSQ